MKGDTRVRDLYQKHVRARAQSNADHFGVPYVCFFDTSGGYRAERYDPNLTCHRTGTVLHPQGEKK